MAETKPKQEKKNRPLTAEQDRYIKKLGIEKSLKGTNPLSYEALQKIINYFKDNRDIELDQIQDEENPYKLFIRALNKGLFPNQGKNAVEFLKALKGSPEERKIAKKFVSDLGRGNEQISTSKEKDALKKLAEIRSQNDTEKSKNKVSTTIDLISNTANTWEKFSKILDKTEREQLNYKTEKLPEEASLQLKQITELNVATNTAMRLEDEMKTLLKLPGAEKNPTLQLQIKNIEKELAALDKKIDQLMFKILGEEPQEVTPEILDKFAKKLLEISKEVTPYIDREFRRMDILREFSRSVGVQNINNSKIFKVRKEGKDGQVFSAETERIQIKEIYFDAGENEDEIMIGMPVVKFVYLDREGQENKVQEMNDLNFKQHFIYLLDGYEEETVAKTPQKREHTPSVGEVFSSPTLGQFKIAEIKNGKIITDRELKVIPKEWLPRNAVNNPEVYKDQVKKEFNKKEFNKLILLHNCFSNEDFDRPLSDEILETPMYPESLKKVQEEAKKEVEDEVEKDVEREAEQKTKKAEDTIKKAIEEKSKQKETPEGREDAITKMRNVNKEIHDSFNEEFKEEALPYNVIHKVDDMEEGKIESSLSKFYKQTRFLSVSDIFHLVKACWDYHMRKFERNQKERYSSITKNLPYFGPEMERINQSAENEEVHQFQETYEHKGISFILQRMRITNNRDEMKACFLVLTHKGQMRFEDIDVWRNMNKFLPSKYYIPIPRNGDPTTVVSDNKDSPNYRKTGVNFLESAVDYLWGPGMYSEWYAQNKSTYESQAQKFHAEGKELEGVQGGHARRLEILLREHKEGHFVDPQEYEGLILHAIVAGKSTLEAKVYFLVAGMAAKNPEGRTLLPWDRMAHVNSEMLIRFPIMEYINAPIKRKKDGGKPERHRFTIDDYAHWLEYFDGGSHENCRPTQNVTDFIWKYMIPSHEVNTRINKALRNAENFDHDDMHGYLPPASTQVIDNACRTVGGGGKHLLTIEGYMNAAAGFDEYLKTLGENGQKQPMIQAFCSYTRFEAIMMKRWKKYGTGSADYARMDERILNKPCVVTDDVPKKFFNEVDALRKKVAEAYAKKGDDRLVKLLTNITRDTSTWDMQNKKQRQAQDKIQHDLELFDDVFRDVVKMDNAETLVQVVSGAVKNEELTGIPSNLDKVGGELKITR